MNALTIIQIALPTPKRCYFDYLLPDSIPIECLQPGIRLRVPFQNRELIGIFIQPIRRSEVPAHKLKTIIEILDESPVLPPDILKLCQWIADYYHYPIGEVMLSALPGWLRKGKKIENPLSELVNHSKTKSAPLILTAEQEQALHAILEENQFSVHVLNGITGSGKTEVYLQAIAEVLKKGMQVLVLVPEIGLTPQTIQRFQDRFVEPVVAIHSGITEKQRYKAWFQAKFGLAKIVIGTRSAVFTPFLNLRMIIIDEEHALSFKQQEGFRYHARDVAIKRAHSHQIPIILGSATPSLETLHNVYNDRYRQHYLKNRPGKASLPTFEILNINNIILEQGLSPPLLVEMRQHLENGNQVMLFLNRRGFAPVILCDACGWMALCKRCDVRMTYHFRASRLHCHHCDSKVSVPTLCQGCGSTDLQAIGQGTERLEKIIASHFPNYKIARIDRDSTRRKGSLDDLLEKIQLGEYQILIGTQMLAKGHHFPKVTLVAIVDTDGGFFSSDFRALERMGQLVLQVAGRAGRLDQKGKVILQTRHPHHPLLLQLIHENYNIFCDTLLTERKRAELPPYVFFALFRAESHQQNYAHDFLNTIKSKINEKNISVSGPLIAPMPRRAGKYRLQLLLQSKNRLHLQQLLKKILPDIENIRSKHRVRWSLDVDPLEIF